MNICLFKGNITNNLELEKTDKGKSILRFAIAVNRSKKNPAGGYEADFVNLTAFGKTAETIAKLCEKGEPIIVQTIFRQDKFFNKDTGKEQFGYGFIVQTFEFCLPLKYKKNDDYKYDIEADSADKQVEDNNNEEDSLFDL